MASGQSSKASNGASGISTRSRTRQRDNQKTPGKRSTSGASTLTSPTSQLDEYFPPRKSQRLAGKYAKNSFRQAREHGNVSYVPPLTGLLGTIPLEVRQLVCASEPTRRVAHCIP